MIPHKLNSKLLILAIIGIVLYFSSNIFMNIKQGDAMGNLAAPSVTKAEAQDAAVRFASEKLMFTAAKVEAMYQSDKYASGYIAKNGLMDAYREHLQEKVPLDYWMIVASDSTGRSIRIKTSMDTPDVKGWDMSESHSSSRAENHYTVAEKALAEAGYNPADWNYSEEPLISSQSADSFIFVSKTEKLGEAVPSVTIGVQNGKAVSVSAGLKVPDSYMDWIKNQEKLAKYMTWGFLFFTVAMGITALVLAIVKGREVRWSRGILMTVIFFALYLAQNFNVSEAMMSAQGLDPRAESLAKMFMVIITVFLSLLMAAAVWFCLLSGEQQWRSMGERLWSRWRDPEFGQDVFYGMGRGYLICLFILGIQQVAFLIAGEVFDSFSITDPAQSTMNMRWAFLFPTTAWVAAIMEEGIFRLFGIALFKRMFRNNFMAVLVSSLIWGLGHTSYTIYPSYTRLFEVTLLGFIFGYTMLRYGFLTAVFTHASMNSLLMAIYLVVEKPGGSSILWALFYVALPTLIGYAIRYLHPRLGGRHRPQNPEPVLPPPPLMP